MIAICLQHTTQTITHVVSADVAIYDIGEILKTYQKCEFVFELANEQRHTNTCMYFTLIAYDPGRWRMQAVIYPCM